MLPLQPPLSEHRGTTPHPVQRLQRHLNHPDTSGQAKVGLDNPHRVHKHAPPHGYRRRLGRAWRKGALIPAPGSAVGRQTFQEWLDAIGAA